MAGHLLAVKQLFPSVQVIFESYFFKVNPCSISWLLLMFRTSLCVGGGGGQGGGRPGEKGVGVYERREKRGREAGFPRWWEAGEKGKNYATLRNISQSKNCEGAGAKKYRAGTGIKGYGKREVQRLFVEFH